MHDKKIAFHILNTGLLGLLITLVRARATICCYLVYLTHSMRISSIEGLSSAIISRSLNISLPHVPPSPSLFGLSHPHISPPDRFRLSVRRSSWCPIYFLPVCGLHLSYCARPSFFFKYYYMIRETPLLSSHCICDVFNFCFLLDPCIPF